MDEEIAALEHTSTLGLVPLPPNVTPITCKWVYNVKTRSNCSLERYKDHLAAWVSSRSTVMTIRRHLILLLT